MELVSIVLAVLFVVIAFCLHQWRSLNTVPNTEFVRQWRKDNPGKELKIAPGNSPWPVFGNMFELVPVSGADVNRAMLITEWHEKYGDTIAYHIPVATQLIVVRSPESIKQVLSTKFKEGVYQKGQPFIEQFMDFLGKGIFNVNGKAWEEQRRNASHLFHVQHMKTHVDVFARHTDRLIRRVTQIQNDHPNEGVDMQDFFMRYTLDSFGEIGFGVQLNAIDQDVNEFQQAFDYVQTATDKRGQKGALWRLFETLMPDKRHIADLAYMNKTCADIIAARRKESKADLEQRTDLLSHLLLRQMEIKEGGEESHVGYTDEDLRDATMNFLIAGRDTTAVLLTWCTYLLSQHPDVEEKLVEELKELGDEPISFQNQKKLKYMKQVLSETLRLYPPVPIDGFSTAETEDVLPGNFYVPPHSPVLYSAYAVHRNPKLWPNPDKFDPDRFATPPEPFSFVAFHGGPRVCLGQEMAYIEAKVMLSKVLRSGIRFRLARNHKVELKCAIMLTAKNGMKMNVTTVA
eukprot:TRINITY_DN7534_c0_g1_i1.p1 TRINITY_DN7534_c0_g1~~TRINITY_DN7534_c0_g1_i1.p1  ORF type:complete len:565 (-),score=91.39 TRINITY_DN7534_c0_g1_i1:30-1577(-)